MAGVDWDAFERVQGRLREMWPSLTTRRRDGKRTIIVMCSVNFANVPDHVRPLIQTYEERYLPMVLALARQRDARVVYVTSQSVLPRLLEYYLNVIPGTDPGDLRSRLVALSIGDPGPAPLTRKVLDRPRVVERMRELIAESGPGVIVPFQTTELEAELAVALDVPVLGCDPRLLSLGSKTGSREVFVAAGVPAARGAQGLHTEEEILDALEALVATDAPDQVIIKLDDLLSGLGNANLRLEGARDRETLRARLAHLLPEDDTMDARTFLARFAVEGGVVEERLAGEETTSPSVQMRADPDGAVEVLSTHDQILGGPTGQTFFGCRFPADPRYAQMITMHGRRIGEELARRGVTGRFAVDFVATRNGDEWRAYAIEINLRNGGTTHPALTLIALTEGEYDEARASFVIDGVAKHYVATDHLEGPGFDRLTPDDVLDVIHERGLSWNEETLTGAVFHMISGIAVAGRLGLIAVADSASDAQALHEHVEAVLVRTAAD